jgi:hypothetical protein
MRAKRSNHSSSNNGNFVQLNDGTFLVVAAYDIIESEELRAGCTSIGYMLGCPCYCIVNFMIGIELNEAPYVLCQTSRQLAHS